MNKVQKFALFYLVTVVRLFYRYAVGRFGVFSHSLIEPFVEDFQKFAEGDVLEKESSAVDKLKNDWGLGLGRWDYDYPAVAAGFPGLEPGDLELSYASTNLVFIVDPDTLEVKW